ncbi:esterase [Rhodococcus sp. 1163]|uniref:alpha/beta hydrolase n=1 Tax=unclassified Rhodococcus (in: high G+C Gram-positive bacteria) TaxID=192944 RepID=UPI000A006DAF|nr:alpha/beta hydrolase [Rhodococcus sp. 1163]ORI17684.1 esterase [Rhodococcus sp. 1163]
MRSFYLPLPLVAASLKPFYRLALNARLPFTVQRKILEAASPLQTLPHGTVSEKLTLAGRQAERITVGATERTTAVLYLHGGAYTIGSIATHRSLAAHLARESASAVYVLDYSLAPENPLPAGLNDAVAAFRELVTSHGFSADRVAIAGDSAGGGLAVATARRLVDDGILPAALGLISPWVDPGARDAQFDRDLVVNTAWSFSSADAYLHEGDPLDQRFAPLHGDLSGLPPVVMHVGTSEVLYPQIVAFHDKLLLSGVEVDYVEYEKLWHVAHLQASILREAADAVHHMGAFLGTRVRTSEVVFAEPTSSDLV